MNEQNEIIRPHCAVLNIMLEVHSLLDDGQCSGKILNDAALKEYGILPQFITAIYGKDKDDCLKKLQEKLSVFKEEQYEPPK